MPRWARPWGDDGGVLSRSPLAQMEPSPLLVKLRACYEALRPIRPRRDRAMLALLVPPLLSICSTATDRWAAGRVPGPCPPDGRGAGRGQPGAHPAAARCAPVGLPAGCRARPCCCSMPRRRQCRATRAMAALRRWPSNSRTASASSSIAAGSACAGGLVPVRLEQGLRATAAHSTLTLDDANSTAVLINGGDRFGRHRSRVERRDLEPTGKAGQPGSRPATTAMPRAMAWSIAAS
jgi:hypothetical protein